MLTLNGPKTLLITPENGVTVQLQFIPSTMNISYKSQSTSVIGLFGIISYYNNSGTAIAEITVKAFFSELKPPDTQLSQLQKVAALGVGTVMGGTLMKEFAGASNLVSLEKGVIDTVTGIISTGSSIKNSGKSGKNFQAMLNLNKILHNGLRCSLDWDMENWTSLKGGDKYLLQEMTIDPTSISKNGDTLQWEVSLKFIQAATSTPHAKRKD